VPQQQTQFTAAPELEYGGTTLTDEVFGADEQPAEHWHSLLGSLKTMGVVAFSKRVKKAQRILRDDGATYNIYEDSQNPARTWDLDLVPSLIRSEEWSAIESGLLERAELLDALLKDIYGSRDLIRHGVIPPEAIFAHRGFLRASHGLDMPGEQNLIIHAADMVRGPSGEMCVLTDRTQAPSGMGYALENRTVMSRVLPSLFRESQVHRLAPFFQRLRTKLTSLSHTQDQPRVVLLTPGVHNETYFEHAYLANYLGFMLVQSGDLVVRNGFVWMKSLEGLSRVDVILRRVDDWFCDPVELRNDSQLGVPGLLEVVRAGRVAIANPLGAGILENPILLRFMPEISKALLGREPRLASVGTYWAGDESDLNYIESHLDELVIKPCFRGSGERSVMARELDSDAKERLLATIRQKPELYVAQDCLIPPHMPTFDGVGLVPRPGILRSFAVAGDTSFSLMPGGLTRVGTEEGGFLISSQVGSQSKDTWVIASEPEGSAEETKSRESMPLQSDSQLISLPSRVVENLFWFGRYAERAEASLRILRTVFMLLNGEEPVSQTSRRHLLRTVTEVTATFPGFKDADDSLFAEPENELLLVAKDPNRVGSVYFSLNAMLRSADDSKELLSSDTLRVINDIRDALDGLDESLQGGLGFAPEEALDPLVTALMALSGLSQESMIRGIGWQFMEIGRRLERGMQTISIMENLLTQKVSESDENTLYQALLQSVEALVSYRRRYRAAVNTRQVLELVLLDESNPRSLLFQCMQLRDQVCKLPRTKSSSYELSPEERSVIECETSVRLSSLDAICEVAEETPERLKAHLDKLNDLLANTSDLVSRKYFEHRVGPKQLVNQNWEY
jgi:uncharacterized circularly permuted ATP-grasp superfamily protein/uncharacterized alpha-E superfamily protein